MVDWSKFFFIWQWHCSLHTFPSSIEQVLNLCLILSLKLLLKILWGLGIIAVISGFSKENSWKPKGFGTKHTWTGNRDMEINIPSSGKTRTIINYMELTFILKIGSSFHCQREITKIGNIPALFLRTFREFPFSTLLSPKTWKPAKLFILPNSRRYMSHQLTHIWANGSRCLIHLVVQ